MNIRHANRGDIPEGGCPLCKPAHKRYGGWWNGGEIHPTFLIEEGLEDYEDTTRQQEAEG